MFIRLFLLGLLFLSIRVEAKMTEKKIYLVPVGEVERKIIENLKTELLNAISYPGEIEIAPREKLPESAYNPVCKQYHASMILKDFPSRFRTNLKDERVLLIVNVDLYEEGLNFVFGVAGPNKGTCIISLARLREEFYGLRPNEELFLKRVLKEAVHELGHTWGLSHCPKSKCVMHFSNCLLDTDRKGFKFCQFCQKKLSQ